jgi:hypothetical protein
MIDIKAKLVAKYYYEIKKYSQQFQNDIPSHFQIPDPIYDPIAGN